MPGLRTTTAAVDDEVDVVARLTLESILDGALTATGTITAPWTGECRRCLREVAGTVVVEVQEVFSPRVDDDADTYPLVGDHVDLEPMVRDAVLLGLPLAPLCEEACAGPDPASHPVAVESDDGDDEPPADPRWAALRELHLDDT